MQYQSIERQLKGVKLEMFMTARRAFEYINDKSNPDHLRWKLYVSLVQDGIWKDEKTWLMEFDFMNDLGLNFYDDFNIDRYQSVNLPDFYSHVWECLAWRVNEGQLTNEEFYEIMPKLQEDIMASGYSGFTYDW